MNIEYLITEGKEFLAHYNFLNVVLYEYIYQIQKSSKYFWGKNIAAFKAPLVKPLIFFFFKGRWNYILQ